MPTDRAFRRRDPVAQHQSGRFGPGFDAVMVLAEPEALEITAVSAAKTSSK